VFFDSEFTLEEYSGSLQEELKVLCDEMLERRTDIIDYLEKSADSEALSAKMLEKDIEVEMNVLDDSSVQTPYLEIFSLSNVLLEVYAFLLCFII
jgi:hypothetical protein